MAKPFTLRGLPRPPLGRGGGTASAVTERFSPLRLTVRLSFIQPLRRCAPAPLVGEPLAKRRSFPLCQSLPYKEQRRRPPPVAETGRSCWGRGQQDASGSEADAGSRNPGSGTASAVTERLYEGRGFGRPEGAKNPFRRWRLREGRGILRSSDFLAIVRLKSNIASFAKLDFRAKLEHRK